MTTPTPRVEVRIIQNPKGVTRHYVLEGHEVALCGFLTHRAPTLADQGARMCSRCDATIDRLFRGK